MSAKCPTCATVLAEDARFCSQCGSEAPSASKEDKARRLLEMGALTQEEHDQILGIEPDDESGPASRHSAPVLSSDGAETRPAALHVEPEDATLYTLLRGQLTPAVICVAGGILVPVGSRVLLGESYRADQIPWMLLQGVAAALMGICIGLGRVMARREQAMLVAGSAVFIWAVEAVGSFAQDTFVASVSVRALAFLLVVYSASLAVGIFSWRGSGTESFVLDKARLIAGLVLFAVLLAGWEIRLLSIIGAGWRWTILTAITLTVFRWGPGLIYGAWLSMASGAVKAATTTEAATETI